jgi:hypothetical protein
MKNKKHYAIQIISLTLLIYAVFFSATEDLTGRFSIIVISYLMLSFLIEDKKIRIIHLILSVFVYIAINVLGYWFNYFEQ